MRRLRQRHGAIGVRLRIEPSLPLIRCDAVLIVQLLENLIDNALKYAGAVHEFEIIARRSADHLMLAVADRGPGVPPVLREQVFEAFRRGAQTPPPGEDAMPRGAGIGLAVCRAIAQAHGGEMRYRARRGGGASFELWLPLAGSPDMPIPEQWPPNPAPLAEPATE
jgi:two-component system sensor histidine kinase KdpD